MAVVILIIISLFFIYPKSAGKAVSEAESGKYSCLDSDGGINYSVQGTVNQGEVVKATDYCTSDTRLKEHYCLSSTTVNHKYYECTYKCVDGACIEEPVEEIEEELRDAEEQVEDENEIDGSVKESELGFFQRIISWFKR